jgi:A/G-specific adenine glycosylase
MPVNVRAHMIQKPFGQTDDLLAWHATSGRDLPWRRTRDPWKVLVSEVMSQQTQIDRVIAKWTEFLVRWPTPEECAQASLGDVLRLWQGLGYPRRAKHLHEAASMIAAHGGELPPTLDGLLALPGVGPYTARAVMAFAFEADVGVVDTNAARVFARWINQTLTAREVQAMADRSIPIGEGWRWNQAMLDLGATVCTAREAKCDVCPIRQSCRWQGRGPDPAVGSAGVSTKQAPFGGSDRQARGRLLNAASGGPVDLVRVPSIVGLDHDVERAQRVLESLVDDGLLHITAATVSLP